jgi:hypothetical protein
MGITIIFVLIIMIIFLKYDNIKLTNIKSDNTKLDTKSNNISKKDDYIANILTITIAIAFSGTVYYFANVLAPHSHNQNNLLYFFISTIPCLFGIIFSLVYKIRIIGTGILIGSLVSLIVTYGDQWEHIPDILKAASLLILLIFLIWFAYKFYKKSEKDNKI